MAAWCKSGPFFVEIGPRKAQRTNLVNIRGTMESYTPQIFEAPLPKIGIHTYVRLLSLCSPSDIDALISDTRAVSSVHVSNSTLPISEFLQSLISFELEHAKETGHKTIRFLDCVVIMVPEQLKYSLYEDFAEELIRSLPEKYHHLPWFARRTKHGRGHYLILCFCDRKYAENGIETTFYQKNDVFWNPKTGKRCKKTDPEAVLKIKKGTVIRTIKSKFSYNKERCFSLGKEAFDSLVKRIKTFVSDHFKSLHKVLLYRFNGLKVTGFRRRIIAMYNRMFEKVEDLLTDLYSGLCMGGVLDDKFWSLLTYLRSIQSKGKGTYRTPGHTFRFRINIADFSAYDILDLTSRSFTEKIAGFQPA